METIVAGHTRGPWVAGLAWRDLTGREGWHVIDRDGAPVFHGDDDFGASTSAAHAHLTSAAPDLLSALREAREALVRWMDFANANDEARSGWQWVLDDADAAIAKAEGAS